MTGVIGSESRRRLDAFGLRDLLNTDPTLRQDWEIVRLLVSFDGRGLEQLYERTLNLRCIRLFKSDDRIDLARVLVGVWKYVAIVHAVDGELPRVSTITSEVIDLNHGIAYDAARSTHAFIAAHGRPEVEQFFQSLSEEGRGWLVHAGKEDLCPSQLHFDKLGKPEHDAFFDVLVGSLNTLAVLLRAGIHPRIGGVESLKELSDTIRQRVGSA